jgi:hypothetical protein
MAGMVLIASDGLLIGLSGNKECHHQRSWDASNTRGSRHLPSKGRYLTPLEDSQHCMWRVGFGRWLELTPKQIIFSDVEIQENLCFVGGIPIITKFASKKYSSEIRLEAAAFVRQMYQTSTLTLQMFVSCGGLNVLVEFLEEDYEDERDLVLIGVNGVWSVFELQVHNTFWKRSHFANLFRVQLQRTTFVVYSQGIRCLTHYLLC